MSWKIAATMAVHRSRPLQASWGIFSEVIISEMHMQACSQMRRVEKHHAEWVEGIYLSEHLLCGSWFHRGLWSRSAHTRTEAGLSCPTTGILLKGYPQKPYKKLSVSRAIHSHLPIPRPYLPSKTLVLSSLQLIAVNLGSGLMHLSL